MRKIITIIAGRGLNLSKDVNLKKIKINRIWTVYDEKAMWESSKFNTETGLPVTTLDDITLQHHKGVFLEDRMHDWNIRDGKLDYCSRVVEIGAEIKILIDYDEIPITMSISEMLDIFEPSKSELMRRKQVKLELESLRKQIVKANDIIVALLNTCKHEDLDINEYGSAKCNICDKVFRWYCPTSPTLTCEYEFINEDGEEDYNEDDCIYCHEPEERK